MVSRKEGKSPHAEPKKRPPPGKFADGGQAAKKQRVERSSKPHAVAEKPMAILTKKERKAVSRERKARKNKNFNLIQEAAALWEQVRRHDTPAARRSELVTTILKKVGDRVPDLACSHTASRVVQACLKYGNKEQRAAVAKQLEPKLLELAKNNYGRFIVSKLIDLAPKDGLNVFLKAFKGKAAEMLRHPAGAHVLDDLYNAASGAQRNALAAEFYGREYALFSGGTLNNTQGPPSSLHELISAVEPAKRRDIIQHLAAAIGPVIEKGLVDCQLAHRLIAEYLAEAPASLVSDAVEALSGEALLHMLHTHSGAAAACMSLAYGTAKSRKKVVRTMKGHVAAAVIDEWGHLPLITALSVVDDTALLRKFIVCDIQKDLGELVPHKCAHRILLQLLHPDCPRYLPPSLASIIRPADKLTTSLSKMATHAADTDSEDEEEDAAGSADEAAVGGPLGASKKDAALRRKELLGDGLGAALAALCAASASELVVTQHAADVVVEVCRGGEGAVLEGVVGSEAIDAVHAAVVAAVAAGIAEEGNGALGNYFGSRALRRLVLASTDEGPAGATAARFVNALWRGALKGRCAELHESHAAKVVAAVVQSGADTAKQGVSKELKKAGVKDVAAWAAKFLTKQQQGAH